MEGFFDLGPLRIVENSVHVLAAIGSGVLVNDDVDALWA
jgi:hypothetical protein